MLSWLLFYLLSSDVIAIIANFFVVLIVAKNRKMYNSTNVILANLAVADILIYISSILFIIGNSDSWTFGEMMCHATGNFPIISDHFTTLAIAVPFIICMFQPELSTWISLSLAGFLWIIATYISIPNLNKFSLVEQYRDPSKYNCYHLYDKYSSEFRISTITQVIALVIFILISIAVYRCKNANFISRYQGTRTMLAIAIIHVLMLTQEVDKLFIGDILSVIVPILLSFVRKIYKPVLYFFFLPDFKNEITGGCRKKNDTEAHGLQEIGYLERGHDLPPSCENTTVTRP